MMNARWWLAGVAFLTVASIWAEEVKTDQAGQGDPRAAALMEASAKSRYTWSTDISAVSGKFAWSEDGKKGTGSFRSVLHQRGGLTFKAEDGGDVPAEVREHIGSLILHRTPPAAGSAQRRPTAYRIVVEDED